MENEEKRIVLVKGKADCADLFGVYSESNPGKGWDAMLDIAPVNRQLAHIYVHTRKNGTIRVYYTDSQNRWISEFSGVDSWAPRSLADPRREDVIITDSELEYYRSIAGLTRQQLADKSGVSVQSITRFEMYERDIKKASAETVSNLAQALEVTVEQLLGKSK